MKFTSCDNQALVGCIPIAAAAVNLKIGQSSHKMYSNNMVNFQESMTILNAPTKKSGNLSYAHIVQFSVSTVSMSKTIPLQTI